MAGEPVEIWRIYTGEDGASRMEPVAVAMEAAGNGAASRLLQGPGVIVRRIPADITPEWHNAPRRQLVATISGEGEIETGDGQTLVVRPGVITLVEDLTGKGHITRGRGGEDRLCLFIPLDDGTVV
jgi:quercetin dioxygenase-like cupin family protein